MAWVPSPPHTMVLGIKQLSTKHQHGAWHLGQNSVSWYDTDQHYQVSPELWPMHTPNTALTGQSGYQGEGSPRHGAGGGGRI